MSNALISEAYELQQYYNKSLNKIRENMLTNQFSKLIRAPKVMFNQTKEGLKDMYNIASNTVHKTFDDTKNALNAKKDKPFASKLVAGMKATSPLNVAKNLGTAVKDELLGGPTVSTEQLDAQSQKLVKTLQDQNKGLKQKIDELTKENEALTQQLASANATASANAEQAKAASQSAAAAAYPGATISA